VYFGAFRETVIRSDFQTHSAWDPVMLLVDDLRAKGADATPLNIRNHIVYLHSRAGINGFYDFRAGSLSGIGANAANVQRSGRPIHDFVALGELGVAPL
jgi:hypothetical protein